MSKSRMKSLVVAALILSALLCSSSFAQESQAANSSRKRLSDETARLLLERKSVDATQSWEKWIKSFESGYTDKSGEFFGGTEILHLIGHKGSR